MPEERENTQKPKAILIKHQDDQDKHARKGLNPGEEENGREPTETKSPDGNFRGERRKVIVVRKKEPRTEGGRPGGSGPQGKRLQPRVVTAPQAAPTAAAVPGTGTQAEDAPRGDFPQEYSGVREAQVPGTAGSPQEESASQRGGVPAAPEEENSPRARNNFQITPRPAAAAGRVGGRLVGPRPPRDESFHGAYSNPRFQSGGTGPRQGGQQGRTGGRPQGPRHNDYRPGGVRPAGGSGPRFNDRRGPPGAGGSRPGGYGGSRPAGLRPGMPRPGGAAPGTTPPALENKGPVKKTFRAKKPVYTRKEKELEMEEKLLQTKKKITHVANPVPKSIDIMEVVSVSELARKMNLKASDLIHKLMSMGMMVTINQQIDAETATLLAAEFGADVKIISLYDETVIETASDEGMQMDPRPPVVTVMGHVDHGKTKLLDAIRSADVASGEFGGITQHIGAYMVDTAHGKITFLDTPGHEAFTRMRARGAQVTDIVVLVVAADDGVMPQTVEAINHARDAKVPIIVALNKIDKPDANPEKVKSQLTEIGLQPEEWGGDTMFVQVSALKKEGIEDLIEAILLQAEILDLRANYNRTAEGKILESKIDHGRGIVATVMVQKGTLNIGDSFVAGIWPGKVRALFNDRGERVTAATPSMPIEVLGFEGIPNAGDPIQVVEDEKLARGFSAKRQELKRFEDAKNVRKITMDNLHDMINDGAIQELKVIIKADVQGSAEALRSSLEKLSTKEVRLNVIQALPGAINEGDVDLAIASNAIIIGFNVRPVPKARMLAEQEKVDIRKYNVIYKAVEEIEQAMEGLLKPDTKEEVIASVEVRNTFKTPKFGTVAGCYVSSGTVKRSASVHLIREEIVVHTGKIGSLRRFKDDVKEVAAGYECGIGLEGFDDIRVGDQFEVFEIVEVARKLEHGT